MTDLVQPHFGNGVLKGMIEIGLPEPVAWSFDAPGWRALVFIALLIAAWHGWRRWQAWCADAYRRDGMSELDRLAREGASPALMAGLPVILKSVALHAFPREEVAALSGEPWVEFLRRTAPAVDIDDETATVLASAGYRPVTDAGVDEHSVRRYERIARAWIARHERPAGSASDV